MPESPETLATEVDRLVEACNPLPQEPFAGTEISHLINALGAEIVAAPRRRRVRRWSTIARRPRSVVLAGAIVCCLGGAATAATLLTAYTGQYPTKAWEVQAGGPGEYLRSWAPDFCRIALRVSSDLRYPRGYQSWRSYVLFVEDGIRRVTTTGQCGSPKGAGGTASTGALHGWFAASAFCAWVWDWRAARLSRDGASAARAAGVVDGALRWKAIRAEPSIFGWLLTYQAAVRRGDVGRIPRLANQGGGVGDCGMFHPGMQGGPRWVAAGAGSYEVAR